MAISENGNINETWSTLEIGTTGAARKKQKNDYHQKSVIMWLESGRKRPEWSIVSPESEETKVYCAQWESLTLHNGILYRKWESADGNETKLQLVMLKSLRPEVLHHLHDTTVAGHRGLNKTLQSFEQDFICFVVEKT